MQRALIVAGVGLLGLALIIYALALLGDTVAPGLGHAALITFLVGVLVFALGLFARRPLRLVGGLAAAGLLFVLAGSMISVAFGLRAYHLLVSDRPVAELRFMKRAPQQFEAEVLMPSGQWRRFELRGDEWQLDARMLRWQGWAAVALGLDSVYRVERLSGRYASVSQEAAALRTVHALTVESRGIDLWDVAREHPKWLPFVRALYGSSTYMPMADGAAFRVSVTATGLVAEALNDAAHKAVGNWN